MIIEMVLSERVHQPRIGGKKLYHILSKDIKQVSISMGRDKFFDLLRANNLLVERKRSYTKTTNSYHHFHKYSNLVKDFTISSPNQVWAADITYLRTEQGFVYLSLLTDMYSRKIVGWALSRSLSIEGSLEALEKSLKECNNSEGVIHHSDRGVQYCSHEYTNLLLGSKMKISMTEENHCYENSMAERVNGILKDEYMLDFTFKDYASALKSTEEAIMLYNTRRPHWSLKFKTPEEVHSAA